VGTIFVKEDIRELLVKVAILMHCFGMNIISRKVWTHVQNVIL